MSPKSWLTKVLRVFVSCQVKCKPEYREQFEFPINDDFTDGPGCVIRMMKLPRIVKLLVI